MKKLMCRISAFCLAVILGILPLFCINDVKAADDVIRLRVCSWEEYIDEGGWSDDEVIELEDGTVFGKQSMIKDFEDWYYETYGKRVKVEYSCFGTNEELYSQLTLGDSFDLICPSDYMIMKLMAEDKLEPLSEDFFDTGNELNYYVKGVSPYINSVFNENEINGESWSRYAAGYMWGITGFVYNPEAVTKEEASTWSLLLNPKFNRQVTIKDNVRDALFPTIAILKKDLLLDDSFVNSKDYQKNLLYEMNDTDESIIDEAEERLKDIRQNVYSFETDSGKADLISGKVVASLQWSGDGVFAMDQSEENDVYLNWGTPEECTNLWFDGWVMLKSGIKGNDDKKHAAQSFINFLSRSDNVVRNMNYIGYTSVISGGDNPLVYEYVDYCYGAEEDDTDVIEYPVGFFFAGDDEDENYILTINPEQADRQLSAQYPQMDVIKRSAVMQYFDNEANDRINQMWINVRCFNLNRISAKQWITFGIIAGVAIIATGIIIIKKRK